jgi:phospholipid/cholesterol/gamma-HCH transport system substrate-binding protein
MISLETKVGAFVLTSVALLGVTVYSISVARYGGAHVPFRTYLRNAAGMEPGTAVLFGGITVGRVSTVRPDTTDPTRIEISLEVKQSTPLNGQSVAEVGSVSLMSAPVLTISTGSTNAPRLAPGATIPSQEALSMDDLQRRVAVLADTAQSALVQVTGDLNGISADTRKLLANLDDLTGVTNRKHVARLLTNADDMVQHVSPDLQQISRQAVDLTRRANVIAAKIEPMIDTLHATATNANQTVTEVRRPAAADLVELQRTLLDMRSLISSLQKVIDVNSQNTADTIDNLRLATENLDELTESVKERPWSLVRIKQPKDRPVPAGKVKYER